MDKDLVQTVVFIAEWNRAVLQKKFPTIATVGHCRHQIMLWRIGEQIIQLLAMGI